MDEMIITVTLLKTRINQWTWKIQFLSVHLQPGNSFKTIKSISHFLSLGYFRCFISSFFTSAVLADAFAYPPTSFTICCHVYLVFFLLFLGPLDVLCHSDESCKCAFKAYRKPSPASILTFCRIQCNEWHLLRMLICACLLLFSDFSKQNETSTNHLIQPFLFDQSWSWFHNPLSTVNVTNIKTEHVCTQLQ